MARREVEEAVLRAWAAGRLRCGLAGLLRHLGRSRRNKALGEQAVGGRRRLLAGKGLGALDFAILRAAAGRDLAAEAEAARVRAALRRWWRRAQESRVRAAARAKQVYGNGGHEYFSGYATMMMVAHEGLRLGTLLA